VLLEVAEGLDARDGLADGVVARAHAGPHKVQRRAKGLVAQRLRGVDDVLAVADHHHEAAVAVVPQRLRVHLRAAHLAGRHLDLLPVLGLLRVQALEGGLGDRAALGPHHLGGVGVEGGHGLVAAQLDHDGALVEPDGHLRGALRGRQRPHPLQPVVERGLGAVGGAVEEAHGAVLGAREQHGQPRVEADGHHVVRVPLQRLHAGLRLVVPHLDRAVVRAREQVGLVAPRVVVHAVDALVVAVQREVRVGGPQAPHLDGAVEGGGGEGVGVLGVEPHHHHVVRMALEHLGAVPVLLPVPQLDGGVVRAAQHVGQAGVHLQVPDVVSVSLKFSNLLHSVVVVAPHLQIITACNEPLLSRNPFCASNWEVII